MGIAVGLAINMSHLWCSHPQKCRAGHVAFRELAKHLCDECGEPLPGNDQLYGEFVKMMLAFDDALRPPKFVEQKISLAGFAGGDEVQSKRVRYIGNATAVRGIVERSLAL